jgi:hypothetical protein
LLAQTQIGQSASLASSVRSGRPTPAASWKYHQAEIRAALGDYSLSAEPWRGLAAMRLTPAALLFALLSSVPIQCAVGGAGAPRLPAAGTAFEQLVEATDADSWGRSQAVVASNLTQEPCNSHPSAGEAFGGPKQRLRSL